MFTAFRILEMCYIIKGVTTVVMMVKMNYTDLCDFFSNATLPLYGIIKQQSYC